VDVPADGIGDAGRDQRGGRGLQIEARRFARISAPKQVARIQHGRRAIQRAERDSARHRLGVDQDRGARLGEFADLPARLGVAEQGARAPRHAHRDENLSRRQRIGQRGRHEILDRQPTLAAKTADHGDGAERGQRRHPIGGGIGVAEAAADRAAISHRAIGDAAGDPRQRAADFPAGAPVLEVGMSDAGAEHDFVALHDGVSKLR
jgi:hypothetical protein